MTSRSTSSSSSSCRFAAVTLLALQLPSLMASDTCTSDTGGSEGDCFSTRPAAGGAGAGPAAESEGKRLSTNPAADATGTSNDGNNILVGGGVLDLLAESSENEKCEEWASITGRCLTNRSVMLSICPVACSRIAGVSADTLTEEQLYEDARKGFAYFTKKAGEGMDEGGRTAGGQCVDRDEKCSEWAHKEGCMRNFSYMKETCPKSCHVCFADGTTVVDFGVAQIDYSGIEEVEKAIAENIKATLDYMTKRVLVEDQFKHLRRDCYNLDPKCSFYATEGWCDSEDDIRWMQEKCSPACQSCMTKEYWWECGATDDMEDAIEVGGIVSMFEKVIDSYPRDQITVLSFPPSRKEFLESRHLNVAEIKPAVDWSTHYSTFEEWMEKGKEWVGDLDHEKPWVLTLDNFITDEEADFLVDQGHKLGFEQSTKVGELDDYDVESEHKGVVDEGRTSRNTFCDDACYDHPITKRIMEKMSLLTGLPKANSESLQLLKYEVGEHYEEHHDTVAHWSEIYCGNRILTIFLYLNDPEEGGETRLTTLNIDVKPTKGMALLWPSVRNDDTSALDDWGWHQAMPVKKGRKYGANAWFHLRNYWDGDDDGEDYECM